jgi:hypothetical protein
MPDHVHMKLSIPSKYLVRPHRSRPYAGALTCRQRRRSGEIGAEAIGLAREVCERFFMMKRTVMIPSAPLGTDRSAREVFAS